MQMQLSESDRLRFGVVTARALVDNVGDVASCDAFCRDNGVELLIARFPTSAIDTLHAFETGGGHLMECQLCYRCDLRRYPDKGLEHNWIRPAAPNDAAAIASVSKRAFERYAGHYFADPRLRRHNAVDTYSDWARRLCSGDEPSDEIFVALCDDTIAGFVVVRLNSPIEAEILLGAVAPESQGSGIAEALVGRSLQWAAGAGSRFAILWSHVRNVALHRALIRLNARPAASRYVVHKWYDET